MFCSRNLIVACTFAFAAVVSPLAIESAHAAPPVITSSSATSGQLTINGSNFLPGTASVLLGAYGPLTVVTQTDTQLVLTLPAGIPAGSYTLSVLIANAKGKGDVDESVVTIGGTGSLAGIPCDTGSLDKPDGRTVVAVAAGTGVITLRCESASTNPVLTVGLGAGPLTCNAFFGCFFARYGVFEVDAIGTPVANGFACNSGGPDQIPFPFVCQTQRFGPGATVRLGTNTLSSFVPQWTGCDSIAAGICTVTMTGARTVAVTPVAPPP